ncbi:MAG: JAB domain-containing protein [Oscillospiraceae bacterium]|nr:JAB domain-containing protein [Oscillospiraceae bacterium]
MGDIHDGHRQRVKRRFRSSGLDEFEPHNALELMLFYAVPQRDTNALAHRLIDTFGSFDKVLEADYEQLTRVTGIGENTATLLKLFLASYRYYEKQKNAGGFVATTASALCAYVRSLFIGETRERAYLLCFDARLHLIRCACIAEGGVDAAQITVRRVVEVATANRAVSVVLAHNHPDGYAVPSREDIIATKDIMRALSSIGIELSDHIVCGCKNEISLANEGVLYSIKQELHL